MKRKELKHPAPFVKPVLNSPPFVRGDKRRELLLRGEKKSLLALSHSLTPTPSLCRALPSPLWNSFTMVSGRAREGDIAVLDWQAIHGRVRIRRAAYTMCQKQAGLICMRNFFSVTQAEVGIEL